MSILVSTKNEREEKVLIAFLDSLDYKYRSDIDETVNKPDIIFLDQYNKEIDQADAEVNNGDFIDHDDVELLFQNRRKTV